MFKKGDVVQYGPDFYHEKWQGVTLRIERVVNQGDGRLDAEVFVINPGALDMAEGAQRASWSFRDIFYDRMKKIGEGGIYVGQRVEICPESIHYGKGYDNPTNVRGVVQNYRAEAEYQFDVRWDNEVFNVYRDVDLIPEKGSAKPKPKAKNSTRKLIVDAVKLLNDYEDRETAKYCILYADKKAEINHNKACHAGLNYADPDSIAVVSCIKQGIDDHPWFYKWLIDESPWAPAFIRRYRWSRENKVVVVRTDISSTFMCGALYATRIWEPHIQTDFMKTFRRKFPMGMLYPISCMVRDGEEWSFCFSNGGHFPFKHMPTKEVVKNFMAGVVKNISKDFRDAGKEGFVDEVFGDGSSDQWVARRFREFEGVKARKQWGATTYYTKSRKVVEAFLSSIQEEIMK